MEYLERNKKLYVFFVDLKAAFDTIRRNTLFYKLSNYGISTKMIKMLQYLYNGNKSAVWDGNGVSKWFETSLGVRQGCVLSPLLFALYLDDLIETLPGGICYAGLNIKALLYADDIVIIADSSRMLQLMINRLAEYCKQWSLTINIEKSKVMIFKKHMRRQQNNEKWYLNGVQLEVVKEFKYLGVWMTYNMSFEKHIAEKLKQSKLALNSTWKNVLGNKHVMLSVKYKVFRAAVRSILCYGAEIWGAGRYENVEKLLRFYIKRTYHLPVNTPNYMLHLETGLGTLYEFTLKMHFNYIHRVMNMPNTRLQKILVNYALSNKSYFCKKWITIAEENKVQINVQNYSTWNVWQRDLLNSIYLTDREQYVQLARNSTQRDCYSKLNYQLGEINYFNDKYDQVTITTIFKTRGELLKLCFEPYLSGEKTLCTICNLQVKGDVLHFIGECPIFSEIRIAYYKVKSLENTEIFNILNGKDWTKLASYIKTALSFRNKIIEENF